MIVTGAHSRPSEGEMRRVAERLQSDHPLWLVMFGVYTQEFVAIARFSAPSGSIVTARYPGALPDRMREVELQAQAKQLGEAVQKRNGAPPGSRVPSHAPWSGDRPSAWASSSQVPPGGVPVHQPGRA